MRIRRRPFENLRQVRPLVDGGKAYEPKTLSDEAKGTSAAEGIGDRMPSLLPLRFRDFSQQL